MAVLKIVKCNPDEPEALYLLLVVNGSASIEESVVEELGLSAVEGDDCFYFSQTDGWVERKIEGNHLTIDVCVYPKVLESINLDTSRFQERSPTNKDAIRLLRATTEVDESAMKSVGEVTLIVAGESLHEAVAALIAREQVPIVFAPPP